MNPQSESSARKKIIVILLLLILIGLFSALLFRILLPTEPEDTGVAAGDTYAGCSVYFTGQDLCEYGDCYLGQAANIMNGNFGPLGLQVTNGLGGGVNASLLASQDLLIVAGLSGGVDAELVNTISPYLAEAHDRHIMIVFDGNQFYVPNAFLSQYGVVGSGNIDLLGFGPVSPADASIRPQLLGQANLCFTTPSGIVQTGGGSRINEVERHICNYVHTTTGVCVWSEIKLTSGSSIHIISSLGLLSGHPSEQCGGDRSYIVGLQSRILNFACTAEAPPIVCGNGVVDGTDQCDDGNDVNGDGCSTLCISTTQCNDGVDNDSDGRIDCTSGAEDPGCFPNGMGGGGACDPTDNSEIDAQPVCGNGTIEGSEVCDDGNTTAGDGCSASCQITTQCNDEVDNDGDGNIDCLAGNQDPGCFPNGQGGGGTCNPQDDSEVDAASTCGNGTIETGEVCDDGNTTRGDGCSDVCQVTTQCSDGVDNDADGRIDCTSGAEDLGCYPNNNGGGGACNPQDNNEANVTTQCSDGIDNDGDGRIDCTSGNADLGCFPDGNGGGGSCNPQDNSESNVLPISSIFTDSTRFLLIGFTWIIIGLMVYRFETLRRSGYFKLAYEKAVEEDFRK